MPIEAGIPRIRYTLVPVISGTGAEVVCSLSPQCGPGDQCQSQGAARAPSATQIGQRDQGMGQDRGKGSRAETLGTQGRVYVMVS